MVYLIILIVVVVATIREINRERGSQKFLPWIREQVREAKEKAKREGDNR